VSLDSRFPDLSKETTAFTLKVLEVREFLYFVARESLYNLVNKTNLVHNLFLVYLFLVYLSVSTCFG
jgi:hypothetical protein